MEATNRWDDTKHWGFLGRFRENCCSRAMRKGLREERGNDAPGGWSREEEERDLKEGEEREKEG